MWKSISVGACFLPIVTSSPALADCYWIDDYRWSCTPGCYVRETWWQGSVHWLNYWCGPSPELIGLAVVILIAGVIAAIISGITSTNAPASTELTKATDEANADAAEAQRITDNLKAARAEADRFLETYRRR